MTLLPLAERDQIGEAIMAARLFRPSTERGRARLAAALTHVDEALRRAAGRENIPLTIPPAALEALQHPPVISEGAYLNAVILIASAMRRAVSEAT